MSESVVSDGAGEVAVLRASTSTVCVSNVKPIVPVTKPKRSTVAVPLADSTSPVNEI